MPLSKLFFFFFYNPLERTAEGSVFFPPSPCRSKVTAWGKSTRLNPSTFQGSFVGVPAGRTHSIGMNQKELFFLTNWKGHCANRRRKNRGERQTQVLTWKWLRPNSKNLWPFKKLAAGNSVRTRMKTGYWQFSLSWEFGIWDLLKICE